MGLSTRPRGVYLCNAPVGFGWAPAGVTFPLVRGFAVPVVWAHPAEGLSGGMVPPVLRGSIRFRVVRVPDLVRVCVAHVATVLSFISEPGSRDASSKATPPFRRGGY